MLFVLTIRGAVPVDSKGCCVRSAVSVDSKWWCVCGQ